jgi:hypothetical protein
VNALLQQFGERPVHRALALDAVHPGEEGRLDLDGEVALAARVVTGVAAMFLAVVNDLQVRRSE